VGEIGMIACVGRVLRLSLAVAFVSGLGFVAASASAQVVDDTLVCADPNSVVLNFVGNGGAFSDGNCDKLCKSYTNKCKAFAKNNASCVKKAIKDDSELEIKADCEPLTDKTERKDCKDAVKDDESADLDAAKARKESDIAACEAEEANCVSDCED